MTEPASEVSWLEDRRTGWHATITPPERWWLSHRINVGDGIMDIGDEWRRYGRKRAEAKGRRLVAQQNRADTVRAQAWNVR